MSPELVASGAFGCLGGLTPALAQEFEPGLSLTSAGWRFSRGGSPLRELRREPGDPNNRPDPQWPGVVPPNTGSVLSRGLAPAEVPSATHRHCSTRGAKSLESQRSPALPGTLNQTRPQFRKVQRREAEGPGVQGFRGRSVCEEEAFRGELGPTTRRRPRTDRT